MKHFEQIYSKLESFIRRFYTSEIIKGSILFMTFGCLYLIFTLFIEYFLWLEPVARTMLFWVFILIECLLLTRFIILPLLRLIGLRRGISDSDAARIIGRHFKEVDDKLLNVLQLKKESETNDLILASIEQKSKEIELIPFAKAVVLKKNLRFLKFLLIPLLIWGLIWLTGEYKDFSGSLNRVVNHRTTFIPPAPFYFEVLNDPLETIEEIPFILKFRVVGDLIPEQFKIHYSGQEYYIKDSDDDIHEYTFVFPTDDIEFYFEGSGVKSMKHLLKVVPAPKIQDFKMRLDFPDYLKKEDEMISNTGNATVPAGTKIQWKVKTRNAESIGFYMKPDMMGSVTDNDPLQMERKSEGVFSMTKQINADLNYKLLTSNSSLKDYEELSYKVSVIHDEYPKILVNSDIDSVKRGPVQFIGQFSDDYGLSKLQVVAKNTNTGTISIRNIRITSDEFQEFYYLFPEGLSLEEGEAYEIYFEVFDNDGIAGPKKSVSRSFNYRSKTVQEAEVELLEEQKNSLEDLERSNESNKEIERSLESISDRIKNKEDADWNDKKQLDQFLERQKNYHQMMEKNADKMLDNLQDLEPTDDNIVNNKQQELEKRWEEIKDIKDKEALLKELEELADKLEKEKLLEKMDQIKEQKNQERRSLERILELTKQFYIERKSIQIAERLEDLSEKQEEHSKRPDLNAEVQEELNQQFDSIQKDLNELRIENEELKSPLEIYDSKADEQIIDIDMKEALDNLEESESQTGTDEQKSLERSRNKQEAAAKRMEELKNKMRGSLLSMEAESLSEDIHVLQQILKNLLTFSYQQEDLMLGFEGVTASHADYPEKLKEQIKLKEHFEHIDDSLYALSLRRVEISSTIESDLASAHFNIAKSMEHISENRIESGRRNQRYTMTAANNLTDLLSQMLEQLQNQQKSMGSGENGNKEELNLPDVIKQQQGMMKQMEKGMLDKKNGMKKGIEESSGEQFELYQQQKMVKDQLRNLLEQSGNDSEEGRSILKQMEELERLLLEKGITEQSLDRMRELEHELLEMENAIFEKEKDPKRKAITNDQIHDLRKIKELELENFNINEDELLRREKLELTPKYEERVKQYFQNINRE